MWFNNVLIFQYEFENPATMTACLENDTLKPCPPHARFIYGWMPAIGDELVHEIAGASLVCMGKEERILPRGVINRELACRVQNWETQHGRIMKRSDKAQLAEELEFELLPKSFCLQKKLYALFDTVNNRLIINTASSNQAAQLTSLLRKSLSDIRIEPLTYEGDLAMKFVDWINNPSSLPQQFQLASDCLLFSPDNDKKRFNCKGYELPADEVLSLLSQGLAAAEISLVWNERIQFTLTQDLTIKRLKCLDYLTDDFNEIKQLEEDYQQQDARLALLSGELRELISDLLTATQNKALPQNLDSEKPETETAF